MTCVIQFQSTEGYSCTVGATVMRNEPLVV